MDRRDGLQTDMHRAVDRRAGRRQDARDAKGLILVLREAHIADAVSYDDRVANSITQSLRNIRSEHRIIQIDERTSRQTTQRPASSRPIMLEVRAVGAHYPESAMRVP